MTAPYTFEALKTDVEEGRIDTVLAVQVDMQGRLMGKRFQAEYFVESAYEETHSCNYLLATDMEMETVSGYKSTSWEKGYGDYTMKPVDFGQCRLALIRDALAFTDLAGQIDGVAMDDGAAHAWANVDALDAHDVLS